CWSRRCSRRETGSAATCQTAAASTTGSTCCGAWAACPCFPGSCPSARSSASCTRVTRPSGPTAGSASGTCTRCPPATGWARPRPRGPATLPAATGLPGTRRPSSPGQRGAASGRMRWLHATRGGCATCSGGRQAARRDSPQSCFRLWFRRVVDVAKKSVGKER
ncbi:unnamed protein product, partial [Ixodes persulcatus]